jgi:hypothetical protein
MRRWQVATLEIQQALQSLFEFEEITAWCGGGTLIGAVRDKGFICWDNDLDMFFQHENYKKIFISFWRHQFLNKYDVYYNIDGFWEKHEKLHEILTCKHLDERMLDFELEKMSKTMIKVFAKNGVPIRFHQNGKQNQNYIPIKHFVKHHLTRQRLAYQDDGQIELGKEHIALPNVCMLPMVQINYSTYFISNILFLLYRILSRLTTRLEYYLGCVVEKDQFPHGFQYKSSSSQNTELEPTRIDPFGNKLRLVVKRLGQMAIGIFQNGLFSKKFIAYRQAFFRFEVMPYPEEDLFPLRKLSFEDVQIYVPKNFEKILGIQFGDYRKVPPVESRYGLPFFIKGRT